MSHATSPAMPTQLISLFPGRRIDYLALVTDPDLGEVRVKWRHGHPTPWRCDACGTQQAVECLHTFSAAVTLAEELLGLTRIPELAPATQAH